MKPGSVSTVELRPILKDLIQQRYPHTGLMGLADKVQLDESLIRRILSGETTSCEFDTADRMLCALGSPMAWRSPELEDVYFGATFMQECAIPSCHKSFPEMKAGYVKRYCSKRCSTLAHGIREGRCTGERWRQRGLCLRGHKMTPENTYSATRKDGRKERVCKTCQREYQREWAKKKRATDPRFVEAKRVAQAQWRRQKEAA